MSDHHHDRPVFPPTTVKTSTADLDRMFIPNYLRDSCVDVFIPLHKCRAREMAVTWKCGHERHEYERCQYELTQVLNKKALADRAAKAAAKAAAKEAATPATESK